MSFLRRSFIFFILLSIVSCAIASDNRVTLKNIESFKADLSNELPAGSPQEKVDSYLNHLNLEHSFVESEGKYYAIVRKVGRYRIIYETNLLIRIQMDAYGQVQQIEYELEYTGL